MKIFHHGPSSSFGGCDIFNKIGERSGQRAKGELTAGRRIKDVHFAARRPRSAQRGA